MQLFLNEMIEVGNSFTNKCTNLTWRQNKRPTSFKGIVSTLGGNVNLNPIRTYF